MLKRVLCGVFCLLILFWYFIHVLTDFTLLSRIQKLCYPWKHSRLNGGFEQPVLVEGVPARCRELDKMTIKGPNSNYSVFVYYYYYSCRLNKPRFLESTFRTCDICFFFSYQCAVLLSWVQFFSNSAFSQYCVLPMDLGVPFQSQTPLAGEQSSCPILPAWQTSLYMCNIFNPIFNWEEPYLCVTRSL